jgi:type 1 glutamine amidotransferase
LSKWWIAITVLVLGLAIGAYQYRVYISVAMTQPQMFTAPVLDEVQPQLPADLGLIPILSFSKTNGYRHHESIAASRHLLDELGIRNGWQFYHTENGAIFNTQQLSRFRLLVLNHKSGTAWTTSQREALQSYVEDGGTLLGFHAAGGDNSYAWPWYLDQLLRAQFVDHPMTQHIQQAKLKVENNRHPATQHLTASWQRSDEWYNFEASPRARTNVLISIDETSYDPEKSPMGHDHPMVWWHQVGEGRVFYNAMGHTQATYQEPDYQTFMTGAIIWGLAEESIH